jgi:putative ATPase
MDLFDVDPDGALDDAPLATRMRPRTFDEFLGQEHILAPGRPFRREIEADSVRSMVLWGPPGCGKTTLARLIARSSQAAFEPFHAATEGVQELRKRIAQARERRKFHRKRTILFLDEIHRYNKAQQDSLLPHVEEGTVTLIGATTENPSFELNAPLLSRACVVVLKPLDESHVLRLVTDALASSRGLAHFAPDVSDDVIARIVEIADGDARTALNLLESTVPSAPVVDGKRVVRAEHFAEVLQRHALRHDKRGDSHYQVISALIKSIRGSDPDAAVYWLARLVEAGEDPRFVARRVVISASEDVGNADPHALSVATAAAHAVEYVGMPEAQICLAQAVTYLACAPKSNASYVSLNEAREHVQANRAYPVPLHLRNAVTSLQRDLGHGDGYRYAHDAADGYVAQRHLPDDMPDVMFYHPKDVGEERAIRARLTEWRERRQRELEEPNPT